MYPQEPNFWQRNRVTLKAISVGILILVLLIPTAFIQGLIMERKDRQAEVAAEVSYPMQYVLVGLALCIFYTL